MSEKGKKNKKKTGLGLAIWILAFLVILIVFLVKQEEIKGNFEKSGASALIEKKLGKEKVETENSGSSNEIVIDVTKNLKKSEPVAQPEPKKSESTEKTKVQTEDSAKSNSADSVAKTAESPKSEEKKTEVTPKTTEKTRQSVQQNPQIQQNQNQATSQNTQAQSSQKTQVASETKSTAQSSSATRETAETNTTKTKICFVAIDSDGVVVRKEVVRSVDKSSPLLESLNALLKGPSSTEAKTGCQSYIPQGSKLLGLSIKDGIATLNFNEEFQFNPSGSIGANVQLMQIVYTATNFSTVKKVQFLIEGQKRDYLTEGVWIGSPLSRNSF